MRVEAGVVRLRQALLGQEAREEDGVAARHAVHVVVGVGMMVMGVTGVAAVVAVGIVRPVVAVRGKLKERALTDHPITFCNAIYPQDKHFKWKLHNKLNFNQQI